MENKKYFKVVCKCGHVGKKYFVRVAFPIEAIDGKNAANIARFLPRVKHDYEDAILSCERITFEEFQRLKEEEDKEKRLLKDYIPYPPYSPPFPLIAPAIPSAGAYENISRYSVCKNIPIYYFFIFLLLEKKYIKKRCSLLVACFLRQWSLGFG